MQSNAPHPDTGAEPPVLFQADWAEAWCAAIEASDAYRRDGAAWSSPLAVVITADPDAGMPQERAVWLDLDGGRCRQARSVDGPTSTELADIPVVIEGPPAVWARLLAGRLEPMLALTLGKLGLRRGSLATLLPHARGARELLATARTVPTRFPAGWPEVS